MDYDVRLLTLGARRNQTGSGKSSAGEDGMDVEKDADEVAKEAEMDVEKEAENAGQKVASNDVAGAGSDETGTQDVAHPPSPVDFGAVGDEVQLDFPSEVEEEVSQMADGATVGSAEILGQSALLSMPMSLCAYGR